MSHSEPGHDQSAAGAVLSAFTDQEWQKFETQDRAAGAAVVGLMTGIFLIGLVLYVAIALIVWP